MFGPIQDHRPFPIVLFLFAADRPWVLSVNPSRRHSPCTNHGGGIHNLRIFRGVSFPGRCHHPPHLRLFEAFLAANVVSIIFGTIISDNAALASTMTLMLKVLNSCNVLHTSLPPSGTGYRDVTPFVRAIVVGSAVAVILNMAAIGLGTSPAMGTPDVGGRAWLTTTPACWRTRLLQSHLPCSGCMQKRRAVLWLLAVGS
jgi:hypothetical protein